MPPAGAMRAIAPSIPQHAFPRQDCWRPTPSFFCRRRQRYKYAPVVERPPQSYGQRLKLVEGASARGLICHCAAQSRIYVLCPAVHLPCSSTPVATASRRWHWRTATGTWPKQIFLDRTRPHPACFKRCPKFERLEKQLNFPVRDARARTTYYSLFPVQNYLTEFLTFLR
jgi:hypothetical protein